MAFFIKIFSFEDAYGISYAGNNSICLVNDNTTSKNEPVHIHTYYELVYFYYGESKQYINDRILPVKRGSFLLVAPGSSHSYFSLAEYHSVNICFTDHHNRFSSLIEGYTDQLALLGQQEAIDAETLIFMLERELQRTDSFAFKNAENCLEWLLSLFLRNISKDSSSSAQWSKLISYISNNYTTATLENAAEFMNLSVSHFCRIFKRDFNTTFYQYLTSVRIHRAKLLLSTTDMTVNEIADAVGYANGYCHFYQAFKKHEEMTPYEFKKNWKLKKLEAEAQPYIRHPYDMSH